MRKVFLAIAFCAVALSASAQSGKVLRDSLAKAVETLSFYPDSTDLRLKKAGWNIMLEQWQYARDEYDYILRRNPKNVAALFYRAYVNERQGRYNFARLDYENLLSIVPGHFEAQLGLALLNQKDSHYTEAMDQINSLVSQYPDSATAYAARGGIEKERGMLELAQYDYSKAIALAPDNTDYLLNRADINILLKRKEEARRDLEVLVRKGVPRLSLADLYRKLK